MKLQIKDLNIYKKDPDQGVDNEYGVEAGEFRQPALWYIAAVRFTGKTYLVSKFLKQAQGRKNKTFTRVYIATPSFKSNESYFKDYINEADIFDPTADCIDKVLACIEAEKVEWEEYLTDMETYKEYIKVMKDKFDLNKVSDGDMLRFDNAGFLNGRKKPVWKYPDCIEPPRSLLILDDIIGSKAISQSSGISKCATLNRHVSPLKESFKCADGRTRSACGVAVIILSQSYRLVGGASRSLRENISLLTVFQNRQPKQMEAIEDEIGASVELEKFQTAYKFATEGKYNSLTCDLKPFCECLTFRKNLNQQIIFPDQVCTCGRCRKPVPKKLV
jgi:hypothetical protein